MSFDETRRDFGYQIDELVTIGDHLHNCQTAIVIADVYDGKNHNTMGSATGNRRDIVNMIALMLEQNAELESIILEAVARAKMNEMAKHFDQIKKPRKKP